MYYFLQLKHFRSAGGEGCLTFARNHFGNTVKGNIFSASLSYRLERIHNRSCGHILTST